MTEEEIFEKILSLNPYKGIPFDNFKKLAESQKENPKRKSYKYCLYSWISGKNEDEYISNQKLNSFLKNKFNATLQIYYDIVCLGLTSIEDRPKCLICGKVIEFRNLCDGYLKTCSKECHSELKRTHMDSSMIKKGDKVSEETKQKISNSLKSNKTRFSEEWRRKHSEYMKNFAKTEKGKEFYKKVGEITSKSNIERLKGEKLINDSGYFTNKNFRRGIYESEYFNKTFNYDSGWELKFIQYFENDSIKEVVKTLDRCKDHVVYYWDDGSKHRYLPDFFLEFNSGIQVVIEIKPAYLLRTSRKVQLTVEAGKEYFEKKGIRYYVLTEKELFSGNKIKDSFNIKDYDR